MTSITAKRRIDAENTVRLSVNPGLPLWELNEIFQGGIPMDWSDQRVAWIQTPGASRKRRSCCAVIAVPPTVNREVVHEIYQRRGVPDSLRQWSRKGIFAVPLFWSTFTFAEVA